MRKESIGFLMLVVLVLSGCSGLTFGQTKEQAALTTNAHTGIKGVTMEFVNNAPPSIIFANTPLSVVISLKNEGAAQGVGTLYLGGYDPYIFNIRPDSWQFNLDPKTNFNTFGGFQSFEFTTDTVALQKGTETLPQTFTATDCYQYTTEVRVPVCIDPNPASLVENKACIVTNPAVGGGQGAPVAVTSIQEQAAPGQVQFRITISNSGDGYVLDQSAVGRCMSNLGYQDIDAVTLSSVALSDFSITCNPSMKIRLANNQGTIDCIAKLHDSTSPAFTSVLALNLNYGYKSQIAKSVQVKSLT